MSSKSSTFTIRTRNTLGLLVIFVIVSLFFSNFNYACQWSATVLFIEHKNISNDSRNISNEIRNMSMEIRNTSNEIRNISNSTRCAVILHSSGGRLGNDLFMFATALGLSRNHSCLLYIHPDIIRELNQSFEIDLPNIIEKSHVDRLKPVNIRYNHCTFFPELAQPNSFQYLELYGYWQVYKYFIDYSDEIRRQLRFKSTILNRVENFLDKNVNRSLTILVGIHIRRGDFIGLRRVSSVQFILDAMTHFITKYRSIHFVIVSDDKPYCRNAFGRRSDVLFTPNTFTPADDLATISMCEHVIITVGTFGWWGGFLLRNRTGEVLADSKPDHTPIDVDCQQDVFFPPWYSFLK